ncbi:hypothetical protein WKI65_21190 [Streptomyces sp. MS1.AVA.3]|uniref:hypothetical protein n=1 Tax=Streptomyces decoyicus TaxID=249567 RepID=UPI0030C0F221
MTFKVGVLHSLKGELPARAAFVSVYLARIPALLLTLSIAMDVALGRPECTGASEKPRGLSQRRRCRHHPGALDHANTTMVVDILREMSKAGCAVVIATHDDDVRDRCDTVFALKDSSLVGSR